MTDNNNPIFTSLPAAHKFARSTQPLVVDVETLESVVAHHQYTGHPDDECPVDACMREELEIYLSNAMRLQEECDRLLDLILEDPELAQQFGAFEDYNNLRAKYGPKE